MTAYYNEWDGPTADWLEELIRHKLIADGVVDRRSILDVSASDLKDFNQCHFFAGIGGWSYALRLAGWPDDRPVWTGSPPCQPFSSAGQQKGQDDERHLAPHFADLIAEGRPPIIFGEQVASSAVFGKATSGTRKPLACGAPPEWAWLDDLSERLEDAHYAIGASDIPSAGIGAPHIRQRTFFGAVRLGRLGDSENLCADWGESGSMGSAQRTLQSQTRQGYGETAGVAGGDEWLADTSDNGRHEDGQRVAASQRDGFVGDSAVEWLGLADSQGLQGHGRLVGVDDTPGRQDQGRHGSSAGVVERMADTNSRQRQRLTDGEGRIVNGTETRRIESDSEFERGGTTGGSQRPRAPDSPWGTADWLFCRDGKWRPVEPSTHQMDDGLSERLGHLWLERNGDEEDGQIGESSADAALPDLWHEVGAETIQRATGGYDSVYETSLLRSELHDSRLRGSNQSFECQELAATVGKDSEGQLRTVWEGGAPRPPQGLEPREQFSSELGEPLRFLSQIGTPPPACFPLASGVKHRATLLRGYGNAINPWAAKVFIEAFVDTLRSSPDFVHCKSPLPLVNSTKRNIEDLL